MYIVALMTRYASRQVKLTLRHGQSTKNIRYYVQNFQVHYDPRRTMIATNRAVYSKCRIFDLQSSKCVFFNVHLITQRRRSSSPVLDDCEKAGMVINLYDRRQLFNVIEKMSPVVI